MADNYLEKKYEQLHSGPTVIRRVNPSLDNLLHRISSETAAGVPMGSVARAALGNVRGGTACGGVERSETAAETNGTPADAIRQAQLDAIIRSASILGYTFRFETSEEKGSVYILGANAPHSKSVELGEIILAMRLKAAELGFRSEVEIVRELLRAPQPHLATMRFFRSSSRY